MSQRQRRYAPQQIGIQLPCERNNTGFCHADKTASAVAACSHTEFYNLYVRAVTGRRVVALLLLPRDMIRQNRSKFVTIKNMARCANRIKTIMVTTAIRPTFQLQQADDNEPATAEQDSVNRRCPGPSARHQIAI